MMKDPFMLKNGMYLHALQPVVMFLGDALFRIHQNDLSSAPCALLGVGTFSRCELLVL